MVSFDSKKILTVDNYNTDECLGTCSDLGTRLHSSLMHPLPHSLFVANRCSRMEVAVPLIMISSVAIKGNVSLLL